MQVIKSIYSQADDSFLFTWVKQSDVKAFRELYNRRAAIELTASLKAYLHQALRYRVFNEHRSELITNNHQKIHFSTHHCKSDFSIPLERKEPEAKINTILHSLPERCRQVFLLSRNDYLSNKDIAIVLNITLSTVEKHISRALHIVRSQIQYYQYMKAGSSCMKSGWSIAGTCKSAGMG